MTTYSYISVAGYPYQDGRPTRFTVCRERSGMIERTLGQIDGREPNLVAYALDGSRLGTFETRRAAAEALDAAAVR